MGYNEITLPQWQQLIRRVFGLVGPGGNVPVVAPEITPVVMLQPDLAEFRRLRGEKMWSTYRRNDSNVGTAGTIGLVNPSTSGVIVVVEQAVLGGLTATTPSETTLVIDTQANVEGSTPTVAGVTGFATRDSREITPGAGQSGAILRSGPVAVPAVGFKLTGVTMATPAGGVLQFAVPVNDIVLFPGFGILAVAAQTGVGTAVTLDLKWYERRLEAAEQSG